MENPGLMLRSTPSIFASRSSGASLHGHAGSARGLYAITPDCTDTALLLQKVAAVLPHAVLLQYRSKLPNPRLRFEQASAMASACRAAGVPLIVNDDAVLAGRCGADGVHLGEHDGSVVQARQLLGPEAIVGVSCYSDLLRAQQAAQDGADYVAFGAVFPSSTKPAARQAGLPFLAQARSLGLPVVAIGGITPDNGRQVVRAGADLLGVISGVFDAPDPAAAAQAYRACFD